MKDLKYIKFFEAFKSNKLSKTLKFINNDDKSNFLTEINRICDNYNFPQSELDDSLFTYLPFKKALSYHKDPVDVPCKATSESEFNSSIAIPGEKCQSGKLKRTWGAGKVRVVECPHCYGTGIEPFVAKWKYLKFWFNVDGKYVTTTATDGTVTKFAEYEKEQSIYKYDIPVEVGYDGGLRKRWYSVDVRDVERTLKTANFALILDLDKIELKSKKVTPKYTTQNNRNIAKSGALKLKTDSTIKAENVERYFELIKQRCQLKGNLEDIGNLKKLTIRLLGGPNMLFFINSESNFDVISKLTYISDEIFEIMDRYKSQQNIDSLTDKVDSVNYDIRSRIDGLENHKNRVKRSLDITKAYIIKDYTENSNAYKIFENIIIIRDLVYNFVSNYKIETLYDFEELLADLVTIQGVMNKQRYLHTLRMFFDKTTTTYSYDDAKYYICDYRLSNSQIKDAIEGTERFIHFLKNKYSL